MHIILTATDEDGTVLDSVTVSAEDWHAAQSSHVRAWSILQQFQLGTALLPEGAWLDGTVTQDGADKWSFTFHGYRYVIRHAREWSDVRMYRRPQGQPKTKWEFVQSLEHAGRPFTAADALRQHITGL